MIEDAGDLDLAHPSSERLSAYQANGLSPEEDDAIQEHVASCGVCAERLLDLQRFLEPAAEGRGEGVVDFETAAAWRKLRWRIGSPVRRFFGSLKTAYSIAAMFLLGVVGLAVHTSFLREELRKPVAQLNDLTLMARGSRRGDSNQEPGFQLPKRLALDLPSPRNYPKYRLDFRDLHGRIVHSMPDTAEDGLITFFLPKRFLSPGDYEIEVFGLQGRTSETLGVFDLHIRE